MIHYKNTLVGFLLLLAAHAVQAQRLHGELQKWHKVTLDVEGPQAGEMDEENPFLQYKFDVEFRHNASGKRYLVPGYFAADGQAGESGATEGNVWRVHFAPDETGEWKYKVLFFEGKWAALRDTSKLSPVPSINGLQGEFVIAPSDKEGRDFRSKGRLDYVGERYLQFKETGEYFLKFGSDAPENLLAFADFDGDFAEDGHKDDLVKTYQAHVGDWKSGDPTWRQGKGKGLIGAINYLHGKGANAFSFLTMNVSGDDQNVFPFVDHDTWDRYDVSKLDQWEMVFEHADKLGMFLHFKTLEVENQGLLDNGGIGMFTKLYYRELIARFGHHLAVNWNLCEEQGDWVKTPRTFPLEPRDWLMLADYVRTVDPYDHHIVIHNGKWFDPLYGDTPLTGASLQTNRKDFANVHKNVLKILKDSKEAGKQWAVACDEPGDAQHSLLPDEEDPLHDDARQNGLWGAMMAGAWGTEWYFGYKHAHSDLTCQDFRSRDKFWDQGRICLDFFTGQNIPYWKMENRDEWLVKGEGYVLSDEKDQVVVYLKDAQAAEIDLGSLDGRFDVKWYDPRSGGALQEGKTLTVSAGQNVKLGDAPMSADKDWAIWLQRPEN
ncbi:DUF5060 domain-containing protein [Echinicola vietnamensis]|uniref:DUF5060 domain-containing protein n=1 Tax=Echinicola vietnamensis (strain DSM 17526 / LMG 23754 / KMM 6221) TaxID=926556 RepID=L0G3E6_ECHVK|nr:DUF5060 domain-containing protein [Echinicola vietnamensis]AGA80022.1 hypothetical protein Echvi_3810 [Echinicola vietnamensis DSM 17526]